MKKTFVEGFTLVELSLSMAFIGVLSVAIVLIISNTVSSYRRGLTLGQITTTGMDIVDDMRTAVQNSSSKSVVNDCYRFYANDENAGSAQARCIQDGGEGFVSYRQTADIVLNGGTAEQVTIDEAPIYGVFCTGAYSYIWNTGYFNTVSSGATDYATFSEKTNKKWATFSFPVRDGATVKTYTIVGSLAGWYDEDGNLSYADSPDGKSIGNADVPFRLLKIPDKQRAVCGSVARRGGATSYDTGLPLDKPNEFSINTGIYSSFELSEAPIDLILEDRDNDLAIYDLNIATPAESTTRKNSFYSANFILGTIRGGVNIVAQGKNCQPPTNYEYEEFDYCAINNFSFAVQAGGE